MWAEDRNVFTASAPSIDLHYPFEIDGVDVYSDAVNQTLVAPNAWGVNLSVSLNNVVFRSNEREMTRDVYLFWSPNDAHYRQVVRTHSQDLVGNSSWDSVSYSVGRVDSFVQAWAPGELWFIAASEAGRTVEPPSLANEC